jgi:hypothetical protein
VDILRSHPYPNDVNGNLIQTVSETYVGENNPIQFEAYGYTGLIDDMRLYQSTLTATQILAIYRNDNPPIVRTYSTISTLLTDSQNNVWSNRFDSNNVLYFSGTGILQKYVNNTAVVVAGNGTLWFSGDIFGIAFDTVGNIYLADLTYYVIRKIDVVCGTISTIAGTGGVSGNSGQGGQATSALLNRARSVLIDSNDIIYIVCSGSTLVFG